ncbi:MAG: Ni/Fe-hydrogenase cytochrome b subunit [Candidatus Marinimicrobia bacterium]|nr:Ni/Fe-hydrogenase cytochrome b subunit [Candidatus Neomarinimicrobiota bacterium]
MDAKALKNKFIGEITFWKVVFALIMMVGLYATYIRFFHGLGASTNLSDEFPWGLWVAFDVMTGVGLAAGGFTLAAVVYIFNIKAFKPIVRPAILTAFLGYTLVIVGLLFDLGKPWNVWHPLVMWNPHSVMFEVGWCVMLYTTVLALEFSPIVFEKFRLEKPLKIIKSITIPLVILGVVLSTLHQSSLGSLFLIVPEKMHALWYTPMLPVMFFVSAVMIGFAMVIFEGYLSSRAFNKPIEKSLFMELARGAVFVMMLYLTLKFLDFARRDTFAYLFQPTFETMMFWLEMGVGIVIPSILLGVPKIRRNQTALFWGSSFMVVGFIMNRLNVGITSLQGWAEGSYFPSFLEISVTMMIVAIGFAVFRYVAKNFPVFEETTPIPAGQMKKVKVSVKPKAALLESN